MTTPKRDDSVLRLDDLVELRIPVDIDGSRYSLLPHSELSIRQRRKLELLSERLNELQDDPKVSIDEKYNALVDVVLEMFAEPRPPREVLELLAGRKLQAIQMRFLEISDEQADSILEQRVRAMTNQPNRKARRSAKST